MTSRDFAFWLQGFFEISNTKIISAEQTEIIKKHLNLVFYHEIDPSYTPDKDKQNQMNQIHETSGIEIDGTGGHGIFPNEKQTVYRC